MTAYLITFLLFLLQFIYFPIGLSYFEVPKAYLSEALIFLLLLFSIFSKQGLPFKRISKSILIPFFLLVLVIVFSLIFHPTAHILWGNLFRAQGTFLLIMLLAFSLLSSQISIEKLLHPYFIFAIMIIQLVISLLLTAPGISRAVGTLGEPNSLAGYYIFLWPFLFFSTRQNRLITVAKFLGLGCTVVIILTSGSRSALIALIVQGVFVLLSQILKLRIAQAVIFSLILLLAAYSLPFLEHSSLYENRGEIWISGLTAALQHPIFGVGFGNAEYSLHTANIQLHNHLPGYYVDSAHNLFFDWFIQGGVIGVGVLIYLIIKTITTFIQQKQTRNILLMLGLLSIMSFNPVSVAISLPFWWLIGFSTKRKSIQHVSQEE